MMDVELHLDPKQAERVLNDTMGRLVRTFERASRRWERIAYPGVAFLVILAMLGFYQIRTLSNDMRMIAERIDPQMESHMAKVADNMTEMTQQIIQITRTMQALNGEIVAMQKHTAQISQGMEHMARLQSIDQQMGQMNHNVRVMVGQMDGMRWDMSAMSRSVGKPLNMMNRFIPW